MAVATVSKAIYLNCELKFGVRNNVNTDATAFYDNVNFTSVEITPPKQEFEPLISNMTNTIGASLASVAKTTEPAKIKMEFNYMPPQLLSLILGADVSALTQAATAVVDEPITTVLGMWVPLATRQLSAFTSLETTGGTPAAVATTAYEVDLINGMIKATDAAAVGSMTANYTPLAFSGEIYKAGLSKSSYLQITGSALEKVSNKAGNIIIWCASLLPSAAVDFVKGGYFAGTLEGDLILPTGKASPWQWDMVTS